MPPPAPASLPPTSPLATTTSQQLTHSWSLASLVLSSGVACCFGPSCTNRAPVLRLSRMEVILMLCAAIANLSQAHTTAEVRTHAMRSLGAQY